MEKLVKKLIEKKYTISLAESCTGGLLASSIVSIPDASKVFKQSFVTYGDEAKIKYAHVNKETIDKNGVVSTEVALEMACGVADESDSNVGVGITGFAGPNGENVGLVCFGISINNKRNSYKEVFSGTRNEIRNKAVLFILEKLNYLIDFS